MRLETESQYLSATAKSSSRETRSDSRNHLIPDAIGLMQVLDRFRAERPRFRREVQLLDLGDLLVDHLDAQDVVPPGIACSPPGPSVDPRACRPGAHTSS